VVEKGGCRDGLFSRCFSRVGDFFQNITRLNSRVFSNAANTKARFLREKRGFSEIVFPEGISRSAIFCPLPSPSEKRSYASPVVSRVAYPRKAWGMPPCCRGGIFLGIIFRFFHFFCFRRSFTRSPAEHGNEYMQHEKSLPGDVAFHPRAGPSGYLN
jgi:hypothetical protein